MNKKVMIYFKQIDPILYQLILDIGEMEEISDRGQDYYFIDLVESIINQQLSGKVAKVIFTRFQGLFSPEKNLRFHSLEWKEGSFLKNLITPEGILKLKDDEIRKVGISYGKISYIKDLAIKVGNKEVDLSKLKDLTDTEIIDKLIKIKGIGKWTAEMFLIFSLARDNVFSFGDLGLRTAVKRIYKLKEVNEKTAGELVESWSPYKSYASRILWKSLNNP